MKEPGKFWEIDYSTPISCHFSLTVNPIRAAHAVSGAPGGNVKTAYSVRGSDGAWLVDVFNQNLNLLTLYGIDCQAINIKRQEDNSTHLASIGWYLR